MATSKKSDIIFKSIALAILLLVGLGSNSALSQPRDFVPYTPDIEQGQYCEAKVIGLVPVGKEVETVGTQSLNTKAYFCFAILEDGTIGAVKIGGIGGITQYSYEEFIKIKNWDVVSDDPVLLQGKSAKTPMLGKDIMTSTPSNIVNQINQELHDITLLDVTLIREETTNKKDISKYALILAAIVGITLLKDLVLVLADKQNQQKG